MPNAFHCPVAFDISQPFSQPFANVFACVTFPTAYFSILFSCKTTRCFCNAILQQIASLMQPFANVSRVSQPLYQPFRTLFGCRSGALRKFTKRQVLQLRFARLSIKRHSCLQAVLSCALFKRLWQKFMSQQLRRWLGTTKVSQKSFNFAHGKFR